jgi:hypothetical protein
MLRRVGAGGVHSSDLNVAMRRDEETTGVPLKLGLS